MIGLKSLAMW